MSAHRACPGLGCYPSRCAPDECVLLDDHCAPEGAVPTTTAGAGLTAQQLAALAECERDPWLWRLLPVAVLLALALSYCWPMGFAGN